MLYAHLSTPTNHPTLDFALRNLFYVTIIEEMIELTTMLFDYTYYAVFTWKIIHGYILV